MAEYYNHKAIENKILNFWESNRIPQAITRFDKKKKKFYLLDGPPYVNAEPHVGHIKTTTLKDIWSKFKFMQGFFSWFQPGFDCHGLPIENMVEKELGIISKKDIEEKIGVENFIKKCEEKARGNEKIWLDLYKKLGAWRGWVAPYLTIENYYIQSAWWSFKKMAEKGMLYQGEKPTYWCPHCQTALSGYEVTDSYENVKDPNIYVKFQIAGKDNEYIVISTTTPWTLVSNVAIAVHPDEYYVKVKVGKEKLIISEKRVEAVLKELVKVDYEVEEKFLGKELGGLKYLPVLNVPVQEKLKSQENAHRIILSIPVLKSKSYKHGILEKYEKMKAEFFDFVNAEEGSGCVHVAPGHGPEDYYVGQHYNLPSVSPVDDEGKFDSQAGEFRGMFVKEADKKIVEKLEKKNRLLYFTWIIHPYPLCWRCKSPLIFRLTKQWFLSVDLIKEKMIKENEKVKWLPEFGKERFRKWLSEAVDWCISRQRYWGIPMPVWVCEKCKKTEIISSEEELREKSKERLSKKLNLHKHIIDKVKLTCQNCGSDMKKVPDILDVWFDSGIAPWASLGYPFKKKEIFEHLWPVDLIDESQDQIRGWFYSLIFCGISVFDESPFKTVCMNGWVLDEKGEKMSKSLGNVIWASEAIERLGSDVLRFYFCWEVAPWEEQNFSFKTAEEVRKIFNILWNCYSFFLLYSSELGFEYKNLRVEDKWILSKLNSLIIEVEKNLENFEFHFAARKISNFIVNDLSRFYIKLIRDRVWVSKEDEDKRVALTCLYKVLITLAKILSPISPFIAEEIYQNLKKYGSERKKSVHLCSWPSPDENLINKDLEEKMEMAKKIIEACYSLRQREKIKLRWPVKRILIYSKKNSVKEVIEMMKDVLSRMCNSKEIYFGQELPEGEWVKSDFDFGTIFIDKTFDQEIFNESLIRELIRKVQSMRKDYGLNVKEKIFLTLNSDEKTNEILRKFSKNLEDEIMAEVKVGKLEGEIKGSLEFFDKRIEIGFSR